MGLDVWKQPANNKAITRKCGRTSTLHTSWQKHFSLLSSVSEPKITAGPMCSLWYENNQFGYNEIKIKGKFEQKQIYYDRLAGSGNLKAVVVAAWNGIKQFPMKGGKQVPISPTMLTAWRKDWKLQQLAKASVLSLLSVSGTHCKWLTRPDNRATFSLTDFSTKPQ